MQGSMDIRKWLDETVQPEAPREPVKLQPTAGSVKRKLRSKSDSSILDPRPPASSPHESVDGSADEALQATCSDSSSSSRYARKSRRKTRPERYEPGPHARRDYKGESKKTRRKPRRKKGLKPPGITQTIQAKNLSGDRLTLKPRELLGLFNKGRTSTAIKGRGLPDLVFSEMKFLQKHKDESAPQSNRPRKKRKKDHVQSKEGEISAFFTSIRPVPVEKDSNTLPEDVASRNMRHRRNQPSAMENSIPTVEVADPVSYLGFGSKDPRHDTTSYVSWSESVRAPSTTPAQPRKPPVRDNSRNVDSYDKSGTRKEREHTVFKVPARTQSATIRRTDSTPAHRFGLSSLAPSHSRASRSQSFPPHSSSPRRPNLLDRSSKLQQAETACSTSSMPPSAPTHVIDVRHAQPRSSSKGTRSGATPASRATALIEYRHHDQPNEDGPAQQDQIPTSSDLEMVLQQCNDMFYERYQSDGSHKRHTERAHPAYLQSYLRQNKRNLYSAAQQAPHVRFADQLYHGPMLLNFAGPSIYEQQARHQQFPLQLGLDEDPLQNPYVDLDDLDQDDQLGHGEQDCDGLPEEAMSCGFEGDLDMYGEGEAFARAGDEPVQDLRQENDTVAPGFWRPNMLY